eukprot:3659496-Prymnesium_polylepis.2
MVRVFGNVLFRVRIWHRLRAACLGSDGPAVEATIPRRVSRGDSMPHGGCLALRETNRGDAVARAHQKVAPCQPK